MNILIIGGAGYIGSKLVKHLLENKYKVTVFDRLLFGADHLLHYSNDKNFIFIKGDIRKLEDLEKLNISQYDYVVHLASIVGYPACRSNPELAKQTNIDGTKNILKVIGPDKPLIYASTGSNYGHKEEIVDENSTLNPLSLYAETKVMNENTIQKRNNYIIYRFATAFGSSPRMRLDLLVNDFSYKAIKEGYLVVYEKYHQRSFIHVEDIALSILFGIKNFDNMKNDVYNVGDDNMNYSKEEICNILKNKIKNLYVHYAEFDKDADQRNYIVSYKKIQNKGFKTRIDINDGIDELIKSFELLNRQQKYANI